MLKVVSLWSNYLDNSNLFNLITRACAIILSGLAHPVQAELRAQWNAWGISWSKYKGWMGETWPVSY